MELKELIRKGRDKVIQRVVPDLDGSILHDEESKLTFICISMDEINSAEYVYLYAIIIQ